MELIQSFLLLSLELITLFFIISLIFTLIQHYIPLTKWENFIQTSPAWLSTIAVILFAFVTPFCSCSTIPVIVNMLKQRIPFSLVMIFLFASPLLDPTILTVMGVILGWKIALTYTITAIAFSITFGYLITAFGGERFVKNVIIETTEPNTDRKKGIKQAAKETLISMKQIVPYILAGAAIGALIQGTIPTQWITALLGHDAWWLVPIAAIIGIPLYIRLSMMIPFAHMFIIKGMAVAPVMALLISSAGASLPELAMLKSIFATPLLAMFIGSVLLMATLSGFLFYLI